MVKGPNWEIYYNHEWEFIITMIVLPITSTIIVYLVIQTVYDFWIKQQSEETQKLQRIFKYLTLIYLLLACSYILSSFIIRFYVIMLYGTIFCWIPDFLSLLYFLARATLHIMFFTRYVLYAYAQPTMYCMPIQFGNVPNHQKAL